MDAEVGHAEIVFDAHVELEADAKTSCACGLVEKNGYLLCQERMRCAGGRDHVVDAGPDLVMPVGAYTAALLDELLELDRRGIQNQHAHDR